MQFTNYKIVVFVPVTHADQVRTALNAAGAGSIGDYKDCSFSSRGIGRFTPTGGANPTIGELNKPEHVEEERIETIVPKAQARKVIDAMIAAHPYEEVAYDIYPLIDRESIE